MTKDYESIFQEAHELTQLIEKKKSKLPHEMNLVDLLHANENAHTRILCSLLQFKRNDKFPIAEKFLEMLKHRCSAINNLVFTNPQFIKEDSTTENRRIDLHIVEDGKYSLIIENKINLAGDQPNQLGHYASDVTKTHSVEQSKVFVIYLTRDHYEDVSENTISIDDKKSLLDWKNEKDTGRLILLNYREDILPWIENEVLPSCEIREQLLVSALTQYVDHLKGLFNLREGDKNIMEDLTNRLLEELKAKDELSSLPNKINEIQNLQRVLNSVFSEVITRRIRKDIQTVFPDFDIIVTVSSENNTIRIEVKPQLWAHNHFLLTQDHGCVYGMGALGEGYDSTIKIYEMLRSKNIYTERDHYGWWPYSKFWKVTGNPWNTHWKELWKKLFTGELDAKWLAQEFKQIYDIVEPYANENNIEL